MGRKVFSIAINTYRESVRSKILYSFFAFAVFMIVVSTLFSTSTIGDKMKMVKDFGFFTISLFAVAFVVVAGSALLAKELARRTVFNILAKPVQRWEFLVGKFLGMLITSSFMTALMGVGLTIYMALFEGEIDYSMFQVYLYIIFEMIIICACAMFFSAIVVTPILSGLFTFGAFLAGRSVAYLFQFSVDPDMPLFLRSISRVLYWLFPHLDKLYIANDVVFGFQASAEHIISSMFYAVGYAGILLVLASVIFSRREFN